MADPQYKPPKLKSAAELNKLMDQYYVDCAEAPGNGKPLAWVTSLFPVEVLYAMGVQPYYPENYAAKCAARKLADPFFTEADRAHYPRDLCSYARIVIGAIADNWPLATEPMDLSVESTPRRDAIERPPRPDFIVACSSQCGTLNKLFETMAQQMNVPFFLLDSPFAETNVEDRGVKYFLEELHCFIQFLEHAIGERFIEEKLSEAMDLANRACRLWNEILEMGARKPASFTFFDANIHMAPIVTMRGTTKAVQYYADLKNELLERDAQGIYPVPAEKYRLYWSGIPLWHRLRFFSEYFATHRASVVTSLYSIGWAYDFDLARPMETLAENYSGILINRGLAYKARKSIEIMKKYSADGFVFYSNRSCKGDSFGLYDLKNIVSEETRLPGVVFEGDMCDDAFFSERQALERLDAFFEILEKRNDHIHAPRPQVMP